MSEVMVREIEVGIDGTDGVRCGVIGEIGCSYPLMDVEKKALQAAASAQTKTGEEGRGKEREGGGGGVIFVPNPFLGFSLALNSY